MGNGESVVCLDAKTEPDASAANSTVAVAGACSADDQGKLNDAQAVGDQQDKCGKQAFGFFGIDEKKFTSCVEQGLGISHGCSECYYKVADYGFHNCKLACLAGWCKSDCLACTQKAQDDLATCTGFHPSVAKPCMDGEASEVVV